MHNARFVRVVQCVGDLDAHFDACSHRWSSGFQPIGKRNAFHQLAHDVQRVVLPADLVDAHDIRMVQPCGRTRFVDKLQLLLRVESAIPWNLYGNDAIELGIKGPPDRAEPADADPRRQLEMADRGERIGHCPRFVARQAELAAAYVAHHARQRRIGRYVHRLVTVGATYAQSAASDPKTSTSHGPHGAW